MEFFLILLFGGLIAASWVRIDRLERRVFELSRDFDPAQGAFAPSPSQGEAQAATPGQTAPEPVIEAIVDQQLDTEPTEAPDPPEPIAEPTDMPSPEPAAPAEPAEPAMAYDAAPEPARYGEARRGISFDFEDIFGRRLPIWGGGFALAIAGIFLVRFSIEAGLLTPPVRVALSFVFGFALLAGAEAAFRYEDRVRDPRVRQALAGAGLATLYGAFYLAGTTYGLIGAGAAFLGLASVTGGAIALSFRFGLPSAVIGLVGGFAAPLLVDSDSANVPLLSFYLALITGGLAWSGQAQGRPWLGYAALVAGLGWGALMMFAGVSTRSDFAALGVYLVVLGTVLPAFLHAKGGPRLPHLAAGAIATLQMAVLVSNAGFAPLTWGLYILIGAALAGLGWRFEQLRLGALVAAGLGLWLLIIWPEPDPRFYALIAAAQVAIFAGVPLAYHALGRAKLIDLAQLSAVSLIMGIAIYARYGSWGADLPEPVLGAAMAGLALLPGLAFALVWQRGEETQPRTTLILLAPAALLMFAALLLLTSAWLAPVMAALVTAVIIWCYRQRPAAVLSGAAWASAAVTLITLAVTPGFAEEFSRLGDLQQKTDMLRAVVRWLASAAPFAAMAVIARRGIERAVGEVLATALIYGVVAQVVPSAPLPWIAAGAAMALFVTQPARSGAWATALAITGAWALVPLAGWATGAALALIGEPFLAGDAIAPVDLALRILPLGAALALFFAKGQDRRIDFRAGVLLGLGIVAIITVHSLFKLVFDITSLLRFEQSGMGERSIWQAGLVLAAYGAGQRLPAELRRPVGLGLIAAALAHFGWFTLVLHNPLWSVQHVGPTPITNWLMLAYLTAIGGMWLARAQWGEVPAAVQHALDAATMALLSLLAFSLLRQVFAGSVLTARAVDQSESLLISLLGIALALGFLWWGSSRNARSWRIGSLVLMLVAVVKVFLIDAAGLEGLLRIASFMALGFSLIGIGWVYSRQLSRGVTEAA
jgi:uncharacterized membrane protein